ncbi:hypothetical protein A2955_02050 [Candidatus Woesebacteria bacterium RIFCSPLOWO2_01_FULL_37_19]|uniref:Dockerin domain-containing protein n=1 Tax=Candidatus Woesebacteria bacterium RIFCSPLOWO2_01_FULL_37_19 TaxID=1802514 RepID=A0A1F8BB52_9BACT|nr:MAG: hypothetical protein A2955_02050 [Candidatus Woesebacteria bacterium RIFCSPLOWO2_01_FULL_37_19]
MPLKETFKKLVDFKRWSYGYKILTLLVLLISIPLTTKLVKNFVLYLSKAAQVSIFFSQNPTSLPPDKVVSLMLDSGSEQIAAARVVFTYDNTKVQLANEIQPTALLGQVIQKTSMAEANSTGKAIVMLGLVPGAQAPSSVFEFAKFTLHSITTQSLNIQMAVDEADVQIVNILGQALSYSSTPLNINLNSSLTGTPVPSLTSGPSQTITVPVNMDSYVYNQAPDQNYGTKPSLEVDGSPVLISYLKFNLSTLAANTYSNALFRVKALNDTAAATSSLVSLKEVTDTTWIDTTLTYNNRPVLGTTVATVPNVRQDTWTEFNITNFVNANKGRTVTLAIQMTAGDGTHFNSKESAFVPEIVASTGPVVPLTPTSTLAPGTPTPTPIPGVPDTTLSMTTPSASQRLNRNFVASVNVDSGANKLIGVELNIAFDPSKLQVVDVTPGTFFPNAESANKIIDNNNGSLSFTLLIPPENTQPVQGSGELAKIDFTPIDLGNTTISFAQNTLVAAVDSGSVNMLQDTTPLTVDILESLIQGDINGDGRVDILDYVILFENFGRDTNDPAADPRADLNRDGRIDILDYVILFENFGRTE